MKYRCTHCNHIFESAEPEIRHCPKCFWTTSVAPFSETNPAAPVSSNTAPAEKTSKKKRPVWLLTSLFVLVVLLLAGGGAAFFVLKGDKSAGRTSITIKPGSPVTVKGAHRLEEKQKAAPDPLSVLSDMEKQTLEKRFVLMVPRELSSDEEEVLRKQVTLPFQTGKAPALAMWSKEDFRSFLKTEQARRGIPLGGLYVRRLYKLFDNHYLAAGKMIESGDYVLAREAFLKALDFPVYQNDVKMHRSVALVVLRPYINDVLGKIGAINQYFQSQRLASRAESISKNYQDLFSALDLKNWGSALRSIKTIRERVATFQDESTMTTMDYPPAFRALDGEIQAAVVKTTAPSPLQATDFKALLLDLDLKEKVVLQNTEEALGQAQKDYEKAFQLIEAKDWASAYDQLGVITYPPELVEEAATKAAILEKIITAEKNNAGADELKPTVSSKQPTGK